MPSRAFAGLALAVVAGSAPPRAALTPAEITARVAPAVVAIEATTDLGRSAGTGFIVDPFGRVVTSLHVVDRAQRIAVTLASGLVYDHVAVTARDEPADLALLALPAFGLPAAVLAQDAPLRIGEAVLVLGHARGREAVASPGRVRRMATLEGGVRVFETDARVDRGSSGGPVVTPDGRVAGVLSFKRKGCRRCSLAVPAARIRALLAAPPAAR